MTPRHLLCAVDLSEGSRTALRYAAVAAKLLKLNLTVLTVNDLLLEEAARAAGKGDWLDTQSRRELRRFCEETIAPDVDVDPLVVVGRAADEILRAARTLPAAAIVMGSQGVTGLRKAFFGSTAERVLRDSTVPVLITPPDCHAPMAENELGILVRRVVVPVDLTPGSLAQVQVAGAIGRALRVPVLLVHVIEPLVTPMKWRSQLPHVDSERRDRAEQAVTDLRNHTGVGNVETLIPFGEASEEIAKAAQTRGAGLIVMNLQTSGAGRVGSVTYRVLSLTHVPVLAFPAGVAAALVESVGSIHQATAAM
jgi:nucleotide-binding universal stress UspA family protein